MSTRSVYYRRRFLNRPRRHLGAHVIAEIDLEWPQKGTPYVDARLHLSDCSRHIDLDFSTYNRRDAENALRKLAILRDVLTEYEAGLLEALGAADLLPRR
jgi:hypothetical protein